MRARGRQSTTTRQCRLHPHAIITFFEIARKFQLCNYFQNRSGSLLRAELLTAILHPKGPACLVTSIILTTEAASDLEKGKRGLSDDRISSDPYQ